MEMAHIKRFAGLVRRQDGTLLPILETEAVDGLLKLHIQGAVVDFWATPEELYAREYRLVCARPSIWDSWSQVLCAHGQPVVHCFAGSACH